VVDKDKPASEGPKLEAGKPKPEPQNSDEVKKEDDSSSIDVKEEIYKEPVEETALVAAKEEDSKDDLKADIDEDDDVESDVSGSEEAEDDEEAEEEEEDEPPQVPVRTPARSLGRKAMQVGTPGATPGTNKKRGRPSRAEMAEREKERQAAIARGEPDPELKRKRRKPNKLIEGGEQAQAPAQEKPQEKKSHKKKKPKDEDTEDSDGEKKKKGRKKLVLTAKQIEERELERKRKYQEFKAKQKAKKEKREAYLIMKREEKKAQKIEEKKKEEELKKRMAELRAQYLDDNAVDGTLPPGTPAEFFFDENSQSSLGSQTASQSVKKRKCWGDVGHQEMNGIHNPLAHVTAETLFEYKWPLEGRNSEHYFLQEQVTEYLHVKSFRRKYPDCPRKNVDHDERDFLMEMKIVNEMQADLGLTAIPSSAVLDIMCQDFYDKYDKYMTVLNERKERSLRANNYSSGAGDIKVEEAAKIAAEYNKQFNQERKERRGAYFDMQTYRVHYPQNGKGRMSVLKKPKLGCYPVAMIPGQFVDGYKSYSSKELNYFPINTILAAPPKPGVTLKDLNLGSDGSESDSSDSSSGSSSDSDSEDEEENQSPSKKVKTEEVAAVVPEVVKEEVAVKPKSTVDEVRPHAVCKMCQGNMSANKLGLGEMLLNCTKCQQSCHPTCAGLHLDLIQHVTTYQWECTDCKMCLKCQDPADEDKMLFCDLCDRGYHIYCVGLDEVPSGRWHCFNCAECVSCQTKEPFQPGKADLRYQHGWAHETKINMKGEKVFSHTMCQSCHKNWKKGLFCPDCNGTFDRDNQKTSNCWVCSRTHHISCVGLDKADERFICGGCQRRVQERTVGFRGPGGVKGPDTPARTPAAAGARTPAAGARTPLTSTFSRSGRRVTQINFSNQF